MLKKILLIVIFVIFFSVNASNVLATTCNPTNDNPKDGTNPACASNEYCLPVSGNTSMAGTCESATVKNRIGRITVPAPLTGFFQSNPSGASGISNFLSNLITLIYAIAIIVFVFMLIWGAFDWLISEGDKERLQGAQKKIVNAIIGVVLLAIAFAILSVVGKFTGFTFFSKVKDVKQFGGGVIQVQCLDGSWHTGAFANPNDACP